MEKNVLLLSEIKFCGRIKMNSAMGLYGAISYISIIESTLRIVYYIAIICLAYKGIQAINIFINKNRK